jgi:hypothetical protein
MVDLFCDSFEQVPRRIVLDIDDTEDRVHGRQQLSLFHAHYDSRCFLPIHGYEATTGKPVAVILRQGKTPDGAEVTLVLRHVVRAIRRRWPAVDILIRGDSHCARPEAMSWLERNRVVYVFGLAGNQILLARIRHLAEDAAVARVEGEAKDCKARRYAEFRYAAKTLAHRAAGDRPDRSFGHRPSADTPGRMSAKLTGAATAGSSSPAWPARDAGSRGPLLRPRPSREPDQGAQAAPRLGSINSVAVDRAARPPPTSSGCSSTPPLTGSCTAYAAWRPGPRSGTAPSSTRSASR